MAEIVTPRELELARANRQVLDAVRASVAELREVLDAERTALDRRDSLALDIATADKADVLQRLQALGAEQAQLDDLATIAPYANAWQDVRGELAECRRINAVNGAIVDWQLRHVRRALGILGGLGEGAPGVYGPQGRVAAHAPQRSLSTV